MPFYFDRKRVCTSCRLERLIDPDRPRDVELVATARYDGVPDIFARKVSTVANYDGFSLSEKAAMLDDLKFRAVAELRDTLEATYHVLTTDPNTVEAGD